jgi:hypothetical protein
MTRSISDDLPGWGVLFHGLVGDGSISVSSIFIIFLKVKCVFCPYKIDEFEF